MSRTAKLSESEAASVKALKGKLPVDKLVKKLKLSRSTIYRVFDGTYRARPDMPKVPQHLEEMDELTLSTVQFVLAKTKLEKLIGRPIMIH